MNPTAFASLLVKKYRNQLFPILDRNMEEWSGNVDNDYLESLLEKEVVPNAANKAKEDIGLRVKKVVFNRLAILMRDEYASISISISIMQKQIAGFNVENDSHLKMLARKVVEQFGDTLFASIPGNDPINSTIGNYKLSKMNEITWKCLKTMLVTLDDDF